MELCARGLSQLTHSEVLAEAPVTGSKRFQFPDAAIERKAVLEQFLSLAWRGRLDTAKLPLEEGMCIPEVVDLFDNLRSFLHKYDCDVLEEKLMAEVLELLPHVLWGWQGYCLGALWRNDELCSESLEVYAAPFGWGDRVRHLRMEHVIHCNLWKEVDPRYVFALRWLDFEASRFSEGSMSLRLTFYQALRSYDSPPQNPTLWQTGDVTLISSDRSEFKVHSHTLLSAGFRFKAPHSPTKIEKEPVADWPSEITFTDFETERWEVLFQFLSLAIDSKLFTPYGMWWGNCKLLSDHDLRVFLDTIAFMRKYNCTATLSAFGAQIPLLMTLRVITPPVGFGLGALIGDRDACAASLTFYHHSEGWFCGDEVLPDWAVEHGDPDFLYALGHVEAYANGRAGFDSDLLWGEEDRWRFTRGWAESDEEFENYMSDDGANLPERKRRSRPKDLAGCFLAFLRDGESKSGRSSTGRLNSWTSAHTYSHLRETGTVEGGKIPRSRL